MPFYLEREGQYIQLRTARAIRTGCVTNDHVDGELWVDSRKQPFNSFHELDMSPAYIQLVGLRSLSSTVYHRIGIQGMVHSERRLTRLKMQAMLHAPNNCLFMRGDDYSAVSASACRSRNISAAYVSLIEELRDPKPRVIVVAEG